MWEFIAQNWLILLLGAGVLAYIIYLSITKQWVKVREFTYEMMLCAERIFSDDQGKLKFNFVVDLVYNFLPAWMRFFIKKVNLERSIQMLYDTAKDYLDDGSINASVK